jgi:hypothetical protein
MRDDERSIGAEAIDDLEAVLTSVALSTATEDVRFRPTLGTERFLFGCWAGFPGST